MDYFQRVFDLFSVRSLCVRSYQSFSETGIREKVFTWKKYPIRGLSLPDRGSYTIMKLRGTARCSGLKETGRKSRLSNGFSDFNPRKRD